MTEEEKQLVKDFGALVLRETAEVGGKLAIRGVGVFERKVARPKVGRNPHTGETVQIPSRSVLRFAASGNTRGELDQTSKG